MALVLALRRGEGFTVDGRLYTLAATAGPRAFTLQPPRPASPLRFVSGVRRVLQPGVSAWVGLRGRGGEARVVVDAPAGVAVRRVGAAA